MIPRAHHLPTIDDLVSDWTNGTLSVTFCEANGSMKASYEDIAPALALRLVTLYGPLYHTVRVGPSRRAHEEAYQDWLDDLRLDDAREDWDDVHGRTW